MGEALQGVTGAWPGRWDLGDSAIGRDQEVCVHQVVCHIYQYFQKRAEKLGSFHPLYWQDQVDAYDAVLVPWFQWGGVRKCSHL